MSLPRSRGSYTDCFEILDQALADKKGLRIPVKNFATAVHLRMRLHTARALDRDYNKERYEQGHFMFGASEYDQLVVKLRQTREDPPRNYIYIEHADIDWGEIEMLREVTEETVPALPPVETKLLPSPQMVRVEALGTGTITRRRL